MSQRRTVVMVPPCCSVLAVLLFLMMIMLGTAQALNFKLHGVDYTLRIGPDWETDDNRCKTLSHAMADLTQLATVTNNIRIFSLTDCQAGDIMLQATQQVGLGLWLGLWVGPNGTHFAEEQAELLNLIQTRNVSNVVGLHVSSQAISRGDLTVDQAIALRNDIRADLDSNGLSQLPVTIADLLDTYTQYPELVTVDNQVVQFNHFPFWEPTGTTINEAATNMLNRVNALPNVGSRQVVIGETGWADAGVNANANPANGPSLQKWLRDFVCLAQDQNWAYYWFVAYDSDWQRIQANEPDNVEGHFGLFTQDGTLKPFFQNLDINCTEPAVDLVDPATATFAPQTTPAPTSSVGPSSTPSTSPSVTPTSTEVPSTWPSLEPTGLPTMSQEPSATPLGSSSSTAPSVAPSAVPSSREPSDVPSSIPSASSVPTRTMAPSVSPSQTPSVMPSTGPSATPSVAASSAPTDSRIPSLVPSESPSAGPTSAPPSAGPSPPPSPLTVPTAPSESPTTASPTTTPTTATPTTQPSLQPTSPAPTPAPVNNNNNPTTTPKPSTAPPPSLRPTTGPSTTTTTAPSHSPTAAPVAPPPTVERTVQNLQLTLVGVSTLDTTDIAQFIVSTESWYSSIYGPNNVRHGRRRRLVDDASSLASFDTEVSFQSQTVTTDNNTITYDQRLVYPAELDPLDLILDPFADTTLRLEYFDLLQTSGGAFATLVVTTGAAPDSSLAQIRGGLGTLNNNNNSNDKNGSGGPSTAVIAAFGALAGVLLLSVVVVLARRRMGRHTHGRHVPVDKQDHVLYDDHDDHNDDPVEVPTGARHAQKYSPLVVEIDTEQQSIHTADFDFEKIVSGADEARSIVTADLDSSNILGGEPSRRHSRGSSSNNQDANPWAHLGPDYADSRYIYTVQAPPGKLGVVVDTPDSGPAVVFTVKESSVLQGELQVGDRLLAVDEMDVTALSPVNISRLITTRSREPVRVFTLLQARQNR